MCRHFAGLQTAVQMDEEDRKAVADLQLLTAKPVIYVANVDEGSLHTGNSHVDALRKHVAGENAEVVIISAAIAGFHSTRPRVLIVECPQADRGAMPISSISAPKRGAVARS